MGDDEAGLALHQLVQTFLDEIFAELCQDNRLEFRDFGVFETRTRAARIAQNPKTLERVHVPPKRTVKFKVGRLMKQRLQESLKAEAAPAAPAAPVESGVPGGAGAAD